MSEDREAIAAAYYREQEAKLDALVSALVKEADGQAMELDELLAKVAEKWPTDI